MDLIANSAMLVPQAFHWYEEDRGWFEESARSFFALDRSPFARELPVIAVRMVTEIEIGSPQQIRLAHLRLEVFHRLVANAIDEMKERLRRNNGFSPKQFISER